MAEPDLTQLNALLADERERGRQEILTGGDGFHTFDELYEFRMLYHAVFVNTRHLAEERLGMKPTTVKSLKHSDGDFCFGGGWFIVVTALPTGQISNHYKVEHWHLFKVPAVDTPPAFDGHTSEDVVARLRKFLEG